jgi:hypothetical protein
LRHFEWGINGSAENAGVVGMRRCGTSPFPAKGCFRVAFENGRPQPFSFAVAVPGVFP